MKEFIITWSIENISYSWHNTGENICSPPFIANPLYDSHWHLQLYPRGESIGDFLSLYLKRGFNDACRGLAVQFELSCMVASGNSRSIKEFSKYFSKGEVFGHPRFLRRHEVFVQRKDLYLPHDTLTLRCRIWAGNGDVDESASIFYRTRLDIERIEYIQNIEYSKKNIIHIHSKRQKKELMSINTSAAERKLHIELLPIDGKYNLKFATCKLSLRNKKDNNSLREHISMWCGTLYRELWRMPLPEKSDSIENDLELTIEFVYSSGYLYGYEENEYDCSYRLSEFIWNNLTNWISDGNVSDSFTISSDIWNLYVERVLCDVELKTQTDSFWVHKFVLCARSPVFVTMFSADMKEKRNNYIEIEDIEDNILENFLLFLYTDKFENLEWDDVIGLYYASDKYNVQRLRMLCCSYFLRELNCYNVCELLSLAGRHNDSDFKRFLEDFILRNDQEIFSSSNWKKFANEESLIAAQTMLLKYDKESEKQSFFESTCDDKLLQLPYALNDFQNFYQEGIFCDVIIKTATNTFHAHKTVLGASSASLREKFESKSADNSVTSGSPSSQREEVKNEIEDKSADTAPLSACSFSQKDEVKHEIKDKSPDNSVPSGSTSSQKDEVKNEIEDKPKTLEMLDLDDEIVSQMLNFLYTGTLEREWNNAMRLYRAAVKYQIHRLQVMSSYFLLENLTTSNAIQLLLAAHESRDDKLESVVKSFLALHDDEIFASDEWIEFSKTNSRLANETMLTKYRK